MIAWTSEAEAIGYAVSRLDDAGATLAGTPPAKDGMALAIEAMLDAIAALVMVRHGRQGDALVSIDQLAAEHVSLNRSQPSRTCCQTYPAEPHANGCQTGARVAAQALQAARDRVATAVALPPTLGESVAVAAARSQL